MDEHNGERVVLMAYVYACDETEAGPVDFGLVEPM